MSAVIAVSRWALPFLALVILGKCLLPLLLGRPKEKTYGYLTDNIDGERYALNMWETSIGRSNSCDIVIGYPTVSRFQAVISRRVDGWYVFDLNSRSGITVNGADVDKKALLHPGDTLTFGGAKFRFSVVADPVIRVGKKKKGAPAPAPQTPVFSEFDLPGQSPAAAHGKGAPEEAPLFYDAAHKPQLHFERTGSKPDLLSERKNAAARPITPAYVGEGQVETAPRRAAPRHVVTRPTLTNPATGETFMLTGNRIVLGRSRANDIVLSSPSVSRRHAILILYEDGWAVDDTGSAYGTFLNGVRVTKPQLLFDGDVLQLGDEQLCFKAGKVGHA